MNQDKFFPVEKPCSVEFDSVHIPLSDWDRRTWWRSQVDHYSLLNFAKTDYNLWVNLPLSCSLALFEMVHNLLNILSTFSPAVTAGGTLARWETFFGALFWTRSISFCPRQSNNSKGKSNFQSHQHPLAFHTMTDSDWGVGTTFTLLTAGIGRICLD